MYRFKLTLLILFASLNSIACSCDWGGNFLSSVVYGELVFKGKVVERTFHLENGEQYNDQQTAYKSKVANNLHEFYGMGESISVEIIEIIKGKESRKKIQIFDTDGADCRESTSYFTIGKTYVFSAYRPNREDPKLPNETSKDFAIHGCSENWLEYITETNEVRGRIKGKSPRRRDTSIPYDKLLDVITEHNMR